MDGRESLKDFIINQENTVKPFSLISESFLVLIRELNSLGLDFNLIKLKNSFSNTQLNSENNFNMFKLIEVRLKLKKYINLFN
jgi:hypothetical protein